MTRAENTCRLTEKEAGESDEVQPAKVVGCLS
jgi:hypothetical protein